MAPTNGRSMQSCAKRSMNGFDCTKPKADRFPDRHLFAKSKRLSDAVTFSVPCATAMLHQYTRTLDVNRACRDLFPSIVQQRRDQSAFFR